MAAKEIRKAKLELIGGQAKPGPALASLGINMAQFTKDFNDRTKEQNGEVVPVLISIKADKSCTFIIKTTPTSILLKKAAKIEKGSGNSKLTKVGKITMEQIEKIAKYKLVDSNTFDVESMKKMVLGTAKQMGLSVE